MAWMSPTSRRSTPSTCVRSASYSVTTADACSSWPADLSGDRLHSASIDTEAASARLASKGRWEAAWGRQLATEDDKQLWRSAAGSQKAPRDLS